MEAKEGLDKWKSIIKYVGKRLKLAKTMHEASELIEAGFEYATEIEGVKLFKKRQINFLFFQ